MSTHEEQQKEYWDSLAREFGQNVPAAAVHWVSDGKPIGDRMFEDIAKYICEKFEDISVSSDDVRILEIGCGNGLLLTQLDRLLPGHVSLCGTDISPELLKHVSVPRFMVRESDASNLPYPDSTFAMVYMHSVVQYFSSPEYLRKVMSEITRVLKPGGQCLILDVPNEYFQEEMKARSRLSEFLKITLGEKLFGHLRALKHRHSSGVTITEEVISGKRVEAPRFHGLYVPPDFFFQYYEEFQDCYLEIQPYVSKPLVYRKYRYNFVGLGLIK